MAVTGLDPGIDPAIQAVFGAANAFSARVGITQLKSLDLWKKKDLEFVPKNLEFVPPGLEFVPSGLDFVPAGLEILPCGREARPRLRRLSAPAREGRAIPGRLRGAGPGGDATPKPSAGDPAGNGAASLWTCTKCAWKWRASSVRDMQI